MFIKREVIDGEEIETIDFERTNDDTVEKLRKAIETPAARARLRLVGAPAAAAPAAASWDRSMAETLVDAVNMIAIQAAVNAWKLTDEQAALFAMRREPETHAAFSQTVNGLLDKYAPGGAGEWDLELKALLLGGGFIAKAVQACRAMKAPATVHHFPNQAEQQH